MSGSRSRILNEPAVDDGAAANSNNNNNNHIDDDDGISDPSNQRPQRQLQQLQQISLNGRPLGLRRQPTKYPHGLGISVQALAHGDELNYSRTSTLRSSWEDGNGVANINNNINSSRTISSNSLAELQVRRLKFPLTGNYYLDPQEVAATMTTATTTTTTATATTRKSPLVLVEQYAKRYCRWQYVRWPVVCVAGALVLFGLVAYCIWLHDASVARDKYLQQRRRAQSSTPSDEAALLSATRSAVLALPPSTLATVASVPVTAALPTATTSSGSTKLRAVVTSARQQPKEQKLTTLEYGAVSKGGWAWDKARKHRLTGPPLTSTSAPASTSTQLPEMMATLVAEEAVLVPGHTVRFTSGHQNSFGVPIEEDERVLRLINALQPIYPPTTSTVASLARVSPTIPPLARLRPTAAMTTVAGPESGCYSTTLPMCRGVLDYDLTYNATTILDSAQAAAYEQLMQANCSARALEFVCAALEPECRPTHIGVLPPCRRICKAIFEACSIVIANSDTLSAAFDCNFYPDSGDPHKCEDPTRRRTYCYENEFQCYDRSCIPHQWQCDNIKDCEGGEDEDDCLICDNADEFRCRSNEKCVPDAQRCDSSYDCSDGSDEEDCDEYGSGSGDDGAFDEDALNAFPRIFSYASFLSPNQTNEKLYTYITAATDDESGTKFQVHEITNRTSGVSNEEVTNSVPGDDPKGFVNFRDSKEIMMTSDTENNFKYSTAGRSSNRTATKFPTNTTPLKPAASNRVAVTTELPPPPPHLPSAPAPPATCAPHQLRCVSGKCITVDQLCDKKADCPDGADELACVYKDRPTMTSTTLAPRTIPIIATTPTTTTTTTTTTTMRTDKRTIRTTIRRKVKAR